MITVVTMLKIIPLLRFCRFVAQLHGESDTTQPHATDQLHRVKSASHISIV